MAVNRESTISHLYSPTGGVQPTPTDLEYGELAINIADGKVYFRGDDDSLKTVTSGDYVETFNGLTGTVDTSSLTLHVAGISSDGGITVGGDSTFYANNLTVTSSSGDVTFTLEADSDNDTETDNPVIVFKQDGGVIAPKIGVGGSSSTFTDQKDNGLFLNHSSGGSSNMWIQLATNSTARLTVDGSGNVGIGNATPTRMLDVTGLAKFDGGITLGSGITFPDGTYQNTAAGDASAARGWFL